MAQVRMLVDISGGRADGTEWPRHGAVLDCGEPEAAALVAGGHAEPVPGDAEPAAAAPDAPPADDESSEPESGAEGDGKPRIRDPKETWELHAVQAYGVHPAAAAQMTKADLIAQFGSTA